MTALVSFHGLGWAHGDARDANVACVSKKEAFMIDLAHSQKTDDTSRYMEDVGTLLCSWLHLDVDREQSWEVPIRAHSEALVDAVHRLYSPDGAHPWGQHDPQTAVQQIAVLFDSLM